MKKLTSKCQHPNSFLTVHKCKSFFFIRYNQKKYLFRMKVLSILIEQKWLIDDFMFVYFFFILLSFDVNDVRFFSQLLWHTEEKNEKLFFRSTIMQCTNPNIYRLIFSTLICLMILYEDIKKCIRWNVQLSIWTKNRQSVATSKKQG